MLSARRQNGMRASLKTYPRHLMFVLCSVLAGYRNKIADETLDAVKTTVTDPRPRCQEKSFSFNTNWDRDLP
jgi:hypothetical protein